MALFSKLFKAKNKLTSAKNAPTNTANLASPKPQAPDIDLNVVATADLVPALLQLQDAAQCLAALTRLQQESDFMTLASQHSVAAIRLAAAENVNQQENLHTLQNLVKNKDKAVFRLCKNRLNDLRQAEQEQQDRQERIHYLITQVDYLTRVGYHPEFSGKLQLLKQEWPQYSAEADATNQQHMNEQLAVAEKILADYAQEEHALAQQKQQIAAAADTQQQLLSQASQLLEQAQQAPDNFAEQVQHLSQQWDESLRLNQPNGEQRKAFEHQLQQLLSIQTVLKHYQQHQQAFEHWLAEEHPQHAKALKQADAWLSLLNWPDGINAPAWQSAFLHKLKELKQTRKQDQQHQVERQAQVEKNLRAFEKAIKDGQVKDANKINQQLTQQLKQLSSPQSSQLRRQHQGLFAQLQEMRDWAEFATEPKKEALITAMQALIGSPIAADLLADKIQLLQEEWKTLSNAGVRDHELWQQFSQAADQAFEPCKAYFAAQAELRQTFANQRQALIAELEHYHQAMDWNQADWRAVQKTLDTARATFRTLGPIERSAHHKTQEQFNQVCDQIFAHLKGEYDHNLERKQALVAEAQSLAESEQLQGVVDKVKALQSQWQEIGVTPRGPDQKLWKQFRQHCDALFQRLDDHRQERKSEINQQIEQAEALVQQALQSGERQNLQQANQQLNSLNLPKSAYQRLAKPLQDAIQEHQQAEKQQALAGLFARLEAFHGNEEQWQQACELPLLAEFQTEHFQQAKNNPQNNENATDLCLLMEIIADLSSPEEQQTRRMKLQVQRLADGLGKGLSTQEEAQQLIQRWLHSQPTPELSQRFIHALKNTL